MNKKHQVFVSVIVGILCVFLASGIAYSAEKLIIGTVYPGVMDDNEVFPALVYFKNILNEKTGDAYDVQIFAGGQLGSEVEVTRECQAGATVQMSISSGGALSSFYKKYQAVIAPYLFPSRMTAWAFFDSQFFADFMSGLQQTGLRYVGTMDDGGGFVVLTNSLRPVKTPSDLKGMRIRTEENPAHIATMTAMGASAVPMAWGQVVTSLATGTAQGQFNAPAVLSWAKLWDVQKYVTYLNQFYNTNTWVVNDKWFKAQNPEHQKAILEAAREAVVYSRGTALHLSDMSVELCKKNGMEFNYVTPQAMAEFKKLAQAGYRKWATEDFGLKPELLNSVQKEVDDTSKLLGDGYMARYGN